MGPIVDPTLAECTPQTIEGAIDVRLSGCHTFEAGHLLEELLLLFSEIRHSQRPDRAGIDPADDPIDLAAPSTTCQVKPGATDPTHRVHPSEHRDLLVFGGFPQEGVQIRLGDAVEKHGCELPADVGFLHHEIGCELH